MNGDWGWLGASDWVPSGCLHSWLTIQVRALYKAECVPAPSTHAAPWDPPRRLLLEFSLPDLLPGASGLDCGEVQPLLQLWCLLSPKLISVLLGGLIGLLRKADRRARERPPRHPSPRVPIYLRNLEVTDCHSCTQLLPSSPESVPLGVGSWLMQSPKSPEGCFVLLSFTPSQSVFLLQTPELQASI